MTLSANTAAADSIELRQSSETPNQDLLGELRNALPDEDVAETAFEAKRQARRAIKVIRDELNAKGYYDPDIETLIEEDEVSEELFHPIVLLDPGMRFVLGELAIAYIDKGPREADAIATREAMKLQSGDDAIPAQVINQETELVRTLRELGYAFVGAEDRSVIGDRDAGTLDVTYRLSSGPRVRFGEVRFVNDDTRTKESYLRRLIPFDEGELYDPAMLSLFAARLDETRLYRISNARLDDTSSGESVDGDEIYDVLVTLAERKRNTIELGASYSTDKGAGLTSELTRRNLTRRGDLLVASLAIAELEQILEVQWRRPNEFGYGKGLIFGSELSNEDTDAFNRQTFSLSGGLEVVKGPRFSYGYGVKGSLVSEQDEFGERDLQIIGLYTKARLDRADSILNATKGWRVDGGLEPTVSFGSDSAQYIRAYGQLRGYYPVLDDGKVVLAGRVKAGTVWGADLEALPSTSRFFSGGGGSVRGYAYQGIGPRSDADEPTGGRSVLELAFETRWQVRGNIGVVAFVDAGSVTTREIPGFSDLRTGAGFGVRYDTPAGPLRVDIATPLDKTENDDPVQVYISLGQAF